MVISKVKVLNVCSVGLFASLQSKCDKGVLMGIVFSYHECIDYILLQNIFFSNY